MPPSDHITTPDVCVFDVCVGDVAKSTYDPRSTPARSDSEPIPTHVRSSSDPHSIQVRIYIGSDSSRLNSSPIHTEPTLDPGHIRVRSTLRRAISGRIRFGPGRCGCTGTPRRRRRGRRRYRCSNSARSGAPPPLPAAIDKFMRTAAGGAGTRCNRPRAGWKCAPPPHHLRFSTGFPPPPPPPPYTAAVLYRRHRRRRCKGELRRQRRIDGRPATAPFSIWDLPLRRRD